MKRSSARLLYTLPNVLLGAMLYLAPLVGMFALSLFKYNFAEQAWVGLKNYADTFRDPAWMASLLNGPIYGVLSVPATFAVSLPLILRHHDYSPRMRSNIRVAVYVPGMISSVVIAGFWIWMFKPV